MSSLKKIASQLKKRGFKILAVSDGLVNQKSLINPCIVFTEKHMPKTRYVDEKTFTKEYLKKAGKKNFNDLTTPEMLAYYRSVKKQGETPEYKKWIKAYAKRAEKEVISLINNFNKKAPKVSSAEKLSLLRFENGSLRLGFGNQISDKEFKNKQKFPISKKEKMITSMFTQADLFSKFLGELGF